MRLHVSDTTRTARLLRHAPSHGGTDKEELKKARAMIEQCGYWRRKEELEDAEGAAKGWASQ